MQRCDPTTQARPTRVTVTRLGWRRVCHFLLLPTGAVCARGRGGPMMDGRGLIENEGSWGRRLLVLLFIGLLIALPSTWISSQYLGNEVNATLSYSVRDGWCEAGVFPGLGAHCFGDYT